MGKVKTELFNETDNERAADMLAGDPEYPDTTKEFVEWTKDINDNFEEIFGVSDEREK